MLDFISFLSYDFFALFTISFRMFVNFLYSSLFSLLLGSFFHILYNFSLVLLDIIIAFVTQSFLGFMMLVLLGFLVYSALLRHIFILSITLFKAIFGSFICDNSLQFIVEASSLSLLQFMRFILTT